MIAFTNHALDHLLTSVLDTGVTDKIVRLGSRSADERISQFSIEKLEMATGRTQLDRSFGRHYRDLKDIEKQILELMTQYLRVVVDSEEIISLLETNYPIHHFGLEEQPGWIEQLRQLEREQFLIAGHDWQEVGRKGKQRFVEKDETLYWFWKEGHDIDFLQTQPLVDVPADIQAVKHQVPANRFDILRDVESDIEGDDDDAVEMSWERFESRPSETPIISYPWVVEEVVSPEDNVMDEHTAQRDEMVTVNDLLDPNAFFSKHGCPYPEIPHADRGLDDLLDLDEMWTMSKTERIRLHEFWSDQVRINLQETQLATFEDLRNKHADLLARHNEGKDEVSGCLQLEPQACLILEQTRRQLLQNIDIVGCTTTGSNLTFLLRFSLSDVKFRCSQVNRVTQSMYILDFGLKDAYCSLGTCSQSHAR